MIEGIDVSKWQGEMNWAKARDAGARFAFIRAGSCNSVNGICYADHQFGRNSEIAPRYMPVGYYWFFRPKHSPQRQAEYFVNYILLAERSLPAVCDIEVLGEASRVRQFCELVSNDLGEKIMIYTSPNAWRNYLIGDKSWASEYPLWIALGGGRATHSRPVERLCCLAICGYERRL
jgi:lysozyme